MFLPHQLENQFAYRPTGSTTAALIAILQHVTDLLVTNSHVHVISFDYSKAFDTVSHASVASSVSSLDIGDNIYNWTVNYLSDRTHTTLFGSKLSGTADISAGVIQGSVLGPTLFNHTASDFTPISADNRMFKYADDGYLIVPGKNSGSIPNEIAHHLNWATKKNLKLNVAKLQKLYLAENATLHPLQRKALLV